MSTMKAKQFAEALEALEASTPKTTGVIETSDPTLAERIADHLRMINEERPEPIDVEIWAEPGIIKIKSERVWVGVKPDDDGWGWGTFMIGAPLTPTALAFLFGALIPVVEDAAKGAAV